MSSLHRLLVASLPVCFPIACDSSEPVPTDDELAGESSEDGEASEVGKADGSDSTFTFFRIERDFRKCVSPLCGGYFVSRVNRAYTRCADGNWDSRCYVADLDFAASGLASNQVEEVTAEVTSGKLLLRGEIGSSDWENFGELGRLHVSEAWMGGSDSDPHGLFVRVTDSGIVCITTPCYNTLRESKVNSVLGTNTSELDLSWTSVDDEEISGAFEHVFDDDGLIVAGYRYYFYDGGWQKGRLATQFFERITPLAETDCMRAGCSSQLCVDPSEGDIITTCEWLPEYACFQAAACDRLPDGECGFTPSAELDACLADA